MVDEIRIAEPVQEHFESYKKACGKMRAYLADETINDPVGKRENKGFIFAMDSFRVGSQEEFTAKIVDFYKNKSECEATGQPLNRRNGPELFYFVVKGDEIIGSVNARPQPMDMFDVENGLKTCEKWHKFSAETGVRVTTSTVLLHEHKGKGYAGEIKKQLFDKLHEQGIGEVAATAEVDNERSNKAQNKLVENYGGYSYSFSGLNPENGMVVNYNRYVVNTDTSGRSKDLYKNNQNNQADSERQDKGKNSLSIRENIDDKIKKLRELLASLPSIRYPDESQPALKENVPSPHDAQKLSQNVNSNLYTVSEARPR